MAQLAYFDRLPLHPQPQSLESFSSYLQRMAEENGLCWPSDLSHLFAIPASTFTRIADYPLLSFGVLAERTGCPLDHLLATTLYPVGKKFSRSTLPNPLVRFFAGSLGSHLRYCPACLGAAKPYYSLLWRFLALPGCNKHRLRLLEQCGHCGNKIPLFGLPARLGICPTCSGKLRECAAEQLTEEEMLLTTHRSADLAFLVAPHACEDEPDLAKTVGQRWTALRHAQQRLIKEIAESLGISRKHLEGIEQGRPSLGPHFQTYLKYADALGVSLQMVFDPATPPVVKKCHVVRQASTTQPGWQIRRQQREVGLYTQAQAAIHALQARGELVTVETISQELGLSRPALQRYPAVQALLDQISLSFPEQQKRRKQQKEDALVAHVQQAINTLKARSQPITQEAIGELVQMTPASLRYYPRVHALLQEAMQPHYRERKPRNRPDETVVLQQVQEAMATLKAAGEMITQQGIHRLVGLPLSRLRSYPQVNAILEQVAQEWRLALKEQAHLQEQALVEQVKQSIDQLQAQELPLSRQAVGELVGLSPRALDRRTAVRPLLAQITQIYREDQPQRTKQREQELLEEVRQAMLRLEAAGQPITLQSISQELGLTGPALMYYEGFQVFYQQVLEERRQAQKEEAQQREAALLAQVQMAAEQLQALGKTLTLQGIKQVVGMSVSGLREYPRVRAFL
jgi:AraC-like DNA-binding protein/DNA-binding XRE family transcriptional regulator